MNDSEKIKVFISYATEDYEMAKRLYDDLKNAGIEPWLDREDLQSGQGWKTNIRQVIEDCRYFLLLISKNSVSKKGYIQKKQKIALDVLAEFPLNEIYIIPAKIDNTEQIDERVRGLHMADLSDYEEGFKQIMKVFKRDSDTTQQEDQLDFVNMSSELQIITHQYSPPYLLIVGPLGYGKTKLLKDIRYKMQRQQWLCVSITISNETRSVNDIAKEILISVRKNKYGDFDFKTSEEAGLEVGSYILQEVLSEDRKKLLIQIDDAENLEENTVKELLNQFIPAIADTLHHVDATLKVMFAGRYISNWQQLSYEIRFKPILLTPFYFDAVYQAVANFDFSSKKAGINTEYQKVFSARLMYFTGGHIRAMSQILTKYYRLPMKVIINKEEEFYEIVKPVIDDIKNYIQPDLKDIIETLSVVRRFDIHLLQNFIQNKLIEWSQSELKLEDLLIQTYLLYREDSFLLQGDISRRLLAIDLRKKDFNRFVKICEKAISFYEDSLNDPKSQRTDIIAVELLFQKFQYICYKKNGNKEDFFEVLPDIFNIPVSERDSISVMENFMRLLERDWEFRFTFNYLFCERGNYDNNRPFNELFKKISKYVFEEKKIAWRTTEDTSNDNIIIRSIEFPEECFQAGISILTFFGSVLQKKSPDTKAKVRIEQEGLKVTMVIETEEGKKEKIEKILDDYGLVITGKMSPEEFTNDKILIIELRSELRYAHARIEDKNDIINYKIAEIAQLNSLLSHVIQSNNQAAIQDKPDYNINVTVSPVIEVYPSIAMGKGSKAGNKENFSAENIESANINIGDKNTINLTKI